MFVVILIVKRIALACLVDKYSFGIHELMLYLSVGRYMYIETSSPRRFGDKAKLEYSVPSSDIGKLACVTFYYHMYGYTINTLNVFNGYTRVFTKSGNQGFEWFKAKMNMNLQSKVSCIYTLFF